MAPSARALVRAACLLLLLSRAAALREGQLSFAVTSAEVAENERALTVTVRRECGGARFCSGDVSVAVSSEAPPVTPLTHTASVRVGSALVETAGDLRGQLSPGDVLVVGVPDEVLPQIHHVDETREFNATHLWLRRPFAADALPVHVHRIDIPLPGAVNATPGERVVFTSADLRHTLSRGDRVRIGDVAHVVSRTEPFTADRFSLEAPFDGDARGWVKAYKDRPYSGLTHTSHERSSQDVYLLNVAHGGAAFQTTLSLVAEIRAGDTVKIGVDNYVVAAVNSSALSLTQAFDASSNALDDAQRVAAFRSPLAHRLPGAVDATAGAASVATELDLREFLAVGDRVMLGGRQHTVALPFTSRLLTLDRAFEGASVQGAALWTDRVYERAFGRAWLTAGADALETETDMRAIARRGDTVKVGYNTYAIRADGVFSPATVPLARPFEAPQWSGVRLYRVVPNPRSTATRHVDYEPLVTRLHMQHQVRLRLRRADGRD